MANQNQFKSVVFDLGNVVLTWNVEAILASLGFPELTTEKLRQHLFNSQEWSDMDEGKIAESIAVQKVCEKSGLDVDVIEASLLAAKKSLLPMKDTVSLLEDLHEAGYSLFCLSNMSAETYQYVNGFDFFRIFKGQVISGLEGCMKPDERIYRVLLSRYQLTPSSTLFIDDSLPNVEMARSLGMESLLFDGNDSSLGALRRMLSLGS